MTNTERAESVVAPLNSFSWVSFRRELDVSVAEDGPEVVIGDFLCNLQHLCRERGWDYEAIAKRASDHYEEEVFEEGQK